MTHFVGQNFAEANKRQMFVDNRVGTSGAIGLADDRKSEPSGYDLVIGQMDNLVIAPGLLRVNCYLLKDFTPIALIGASQIILVATGHRITRTSLKPLRRSGRSQAA